MAKRKSYKSWTRKEEMQLLFLIEKNTVKQAAEKLGRPYLSAKSKLEGLGVVISEQKGWVSLSEAERRTGYDDYQLRRARVALGQVWKRGGGYGKNGCFIISEEQLDELCAYLGQEKRREPQLDRDFWPFVAKTRHDHPFLPGACWIWRGKRQTFGTKNERLTPYQVAWRHRYGALSENPLWNQCGVDRCINPEHYAHRRMSQTCLQFQHLLGLGALRPVGVLAFVVSMLAANGWNKLDVALRLNEKGAGFYRKGQNGSAYWKRRNFVRAQSSPWTTLVLLGIVGHPTYAKAQFEHECQAKRKGWHRRRDRRAA